MVQRMLRRLVSPVAIGVYLTLLIVLMTVPYYDLSSRKTSRSGRMGISDLLYTAHQKSIDYRLRVRGPRRVSPQLALLAIDERAVATLGRWPWPRDLLAEGVDKAFGAGAKLLAFDISFAEAGQNPARQVLGRLKLDGRANPTIEQAISGVAPELDMDENLGRVFAKYADKIVAGTFYADSITHEWPAETEFCRDLIFKRQPAAKQWDQEEVLLSTLDPYQPYMPVALSQFFTDILQMRDAAVRANFGKPRNRAEQVLQDTEARAKLHEACDTILTDYRDDLAPHWRDQILVQENPKDFTFPTYDAWLENYRAQSKPNSLVYTDSWMMNTPVVARGTKHTGFFNTEQDADGTIRRKLLVVRTGNSYFPSLSLKAYLVANGYNASPKLTMNPVTHSKEVGELEVTSNDTGERVLDIPVDGQARLLLNYAGPQKMYPYLSFADLMSDSPDAQIEQRVWNPRTQSWELTIRKVKKADFIKDKIFVVGATATGIYDLRVTPFEENYPGAETHLNAIDNIMQRQFFHAPAGERVYMAIILLAMGLTLSLALSYLGAVSGLLLTLAFLIGTALIDQYYLFKNGLIVSIIWPLFLVMVLYVAMTFYRYFTEERGKKELRQTFQKYVSPAIVNEILSHPKNIELGGKKANLTVFFSDVRGFTTISEKLDPRALSDLLNSYLTPMTDIVFKNRGTLDKYMGDAIMAFFGAPIPFPGHAAHACRCALQSLDKLFELQREYQKKGLPTIDIGIGLNTGEVSVGNMGSETVRSYTVMGDAVNLASRLEGINKQYGTRVILSEMTYVEVKDSFVCREVDRVRVKGKILPVKIFELIVEGKEAPPERRESLEWFARGYAHYHDKAWQDGLNSFSKALDLNPTDTVAKLYIERCQSYLGEPPADDWDGVFVMKTK
jgi:adenylate cyclase